MRARTVSKLAPRLLALTTLSLLTGSTLAPAGGAVPDDAAWPAFRGANRSGVADGAELPHLWSPATGENVRWSVDLPGLAHSSPIVFGDTVYVTTAVAERGEAALTLGDVRAAGIDVAPDRVPHRWSLLALDAGTGELRWETVAHVGEPEVGRHVKASHASQTPATDGEVVVAMFGSQGLFAFDSRGRRLWQVDLGLMDPGLWGDPDYQWGPASSPVIWNDLVIVQNDRQADSYLAAFELASGRERWRTERVEKPAWSTPVVWSGDRDELITNGGNWIRAYAPATGEELWRVSHGDLEVITPSPVLAGDTVVVTGGYPPGGNPILALRPGGDGEIAPDSEHVRWVERPGSPYTPTPLFYRERLFVIADNGVLSVYDPTTGERVHRARMAVGAGFSASPVAADGRVYLPSEDGDLFVLSAEAPFEELARVDMGQPLMATPAIADGALFVRGRHTIWAVSNR